MNSVKSFAILIFLVLTLLVGSIDAATVFRDTFETHPLGALLPATPEVGYLWQLYAGTGTSTVENSVVMNGSKALAIEGAEILTGFLDLAGGVIEPGYDMAFKMSWLKPAQITNGLTWHVMTGGGQRIVAWNATTGNYWAWNGALGGYADTGVATALNRWDTVEIVLHLVAAPGVNKVTGTLDMWLTPGIGGTRTKIASNPLATWTYSSADYPRMWFYPQAATGISYWDDISVTKELPAQCGDEEHPYPVGDINQDCRVNFEDFAELAINWLVCTDISCN